MFDKFYAPSRVYARTRSSPRRSKITSSFSPLPFGADLSGAFFEKKKEKKNSLLSLAQGLHIIKNAHATRTLFFHGRPPHGEHTQHYRARALDAFSAPNTNNNNQKWESYFQFPAKSRRLWFIRTSSSTSATRTCAATTTWNE